MFKTRVNRMWSKSQCVVKLSAASVNWNSNICTRDQKIYSYVKMSSFISVYSFGSGSWYVITKRCTMFRLYERRLRNVEVFNLTRLRLEDWGSIPGGARIFFSPQCLRPLQLPIQWVPGYADRSVDLTAHLHLVSSLGTSGSIPPLPYTSL